MDIHLDSIDASERYRLITSAVAPRPIALVTTLSASGQVNAAPFSCFNYMGEDPPLIFLGIELYGQESHRCGEQKDTLTNIERTGEFVVNMTDEAMLERVVACATDFPNDVSETEQLGFALDPSMTLGVPRIRQAPVALECGLFQILDFSARRRIVLGKIKSVHIADDLFDHAGGRIDLDRYHPIARLGGPIYCRTGDRINVPVRKYSVPASS